ncbi:cytochrome c4 [Leeia sp. TBRC 13508]|uniref:Cytochrome c4 n=1 Tax=Leeia speluncae TaxID=2884804 RepID=A0ABS8D5Z8_9NEIS|nr:c-type cytochrome [Leeia speluncae]MCB6183433.1 cytochrome c4 [Leeia speluncae]
MKRTRIVAALIATVIAPFALAGEPVKGDPSKGQQIASTVCAACHAADGNSAVPANPKLAGQHAEYIEKQLKQFKAPMDPKKPEDWRGGANPMRGIVTALSDTDIANVAAYYSMQKPKPGKGQGKDVAAAGERIYRGGIAAKGVPACMACHGPSGAGIPVQYPRLAGQHSDYIVAQLNAFRSGQRANDVNKMMRTAASRMSDTEIKQVAEYIAGLR